MVIETLRELRIKPDIIPPEIIADLKTDIDKQYRYIEIQSQTQGVFEAAKTLPPEWKWTPTCSSLSIQAVPNHLRVVRELIFPKIRSELESYFNLDHIWWNMNASWVRRQYPMHQAPEHHHPHSWHQDGALGFDFLAHHESGALLQMLTCWLTLDNCGEYAPGIEYVSHPSHVSRLLRLDELQVNSIDLIFPEGERKRPLLSAGDCLLMSGGLLHRTYQTAAMDKHRTSLELRFFGSPPTRLQSHSFIKLGTP